MFSHNGVKFFRYLRNCIDIDEPWSAVIPVNASLWLNNWVGIKQSRRNHIVLVGAIETRNGRAALSAEPSHIAEIHGLVYETLDQRLTGDPSETIECKE